MWRERLRGVTAAVAFGMIAAPIAAQNTDPLLQKASISRSKGASTATVLVYEFADFQCPHCAQFAKEVYPRIDSAFIKTGKVRWVFVNLPLPNHPAAWAAHEAAVCAGAVADRFWAMHDRLFATQAEWASATDPGAAVARIARQLGVQTDAFQACIANDRVAPLLVQDLLFAGSTRVNGTPAFIIDEEQSVMGFKSFEEWKALLEKAIAAGGRGRGGT